MAAKTNSTIERATVTPGTLGRVGQGGERDRAVRAVCAGLQVVATGIEGGAEGVADSGEIVDACLDLRELGRCPLVEVGVGAGVVPAGVHEPGDLVEGEPQPLRGLMIRATVTAAGG
jgi:hypothetical protein